MTEYNNGVADGSINDVDEFLNYYGKGDTQKGLEKIMAKLDNPSTGTDLIVKQNSDTATPERIAESYEKFINYLKENMS